MFKVRLNDYNIIIISETLSKGLSIMLTYKNIYYKAILTANTQ